MLEKKRNSVLFLWLSNREFHAINAQKRGVSVFQTYKKMSFVGKLIRRVQLMFNIPGVSIWMSEWKYELNKYNTVIIHASILAPAVVKYIRKINKDIRIIVWYWNPVDKCVEINKFADNNAEIWSFDELDCEKYALKYNTQYYFNNIILDENETKQDVFFLGGDKGRIIDLIKIQDQLNQMNISNYFHITPTGKKEKTYVGKYMQRIPYEKALEYISKSKAILDYVSDRQTGLTLRPLEALFFRKKLITNDMTIIGRDFYKKENIFIIGKDDMSELKLFLNTPYEELEEDIINKYDFDNWLSRFLSNHEIEELI